MKNIIAIIVLLAGICTAAAQVPSTFSVNGNAQSASNHWAYVPAGNGNAQIQFINVASDKAGSYVTFRNPSGASIVLTNTPAAGTTNIAFTSNTTLTNGDVFVIRHATGNAYRYHVFSATGTGISTLNPLSNAVVAGDVLQEYTLGGRVLWGATTNSLGSGAGLFSGGWAQPVLIELDSTAGGGLNVVSGEYKR